MGKLKIFRYSENLQARPEWFKSLLTDTCQFSANKIGTCLAKQNKAGSYMYLGFS